MVIDENVPTSPAVSTADTVNGCADDEAPQLSVPLALIESTPAPAGQFPVIRVCTCDESIIAAVMLPGATAIVPDPVIGPPVRPAPVFTLVTVPRLFVSRSTPQIHAPLFHFATWLSLQFNPATVAALLA